MAKKYWVLLGIVVVVTALIASYLASGHQTPPGQPQLLAITPESLPQFTQEFNRSANVERVVLLMSPTCPVCLEGSSAVQAILRDHPGDDIRVFAVWEPMLPTDWGRPNTHVLRRLSDPRVVQVWDKGHLIARSIENGAAGRRPACCSRNGAWWDVLAAYPPGSKWDGTAPTPELLNGTIVRTAPRLKAQLSQPS
ncbi:MAG TPA: hypothetical protein VJS11_06550 [Acidobacteriaceae bacterium]|nr:hypothetical protein [Acidobacteriaceae bacterium]